MNALESNIADVTGLNETKSPVGSNVFVACDMKRALVVDDETAVVKVFGRIISTEIPGLKVDLASNGLEAVSSFSEKHQAVLVMDINMPVMDGQAAFKEIEKLCVERNWIMPSVVFCTGYAPPDLVKKVVAAGSRHCLLLKPMRYEEIVDAVRRHLEQNAA